MAEKTWIVDDEPNERFTVWTRGNVGEVFPDVVSPLTWSMFGTEVERAWRDALAGFGALRDDDYGDVFPANVGCFGGYCYLNVSTHRILAVRTPGLTPAAMDRSIFGDSDAPPYAPAPGDRRPAATARVLGTVARTLLGRGLGQLDADRATVDAWLARQPDPADPATTDAQLRRTVDEHRSMFRSLFGHHIATTFRGTIPTGVLTDLCTDRLDDPGLVVRLLTGIGDVDSAEPLVALWRLARAGGDDPVDAAAVAEFRRRHGYRGVNEWEGSSPTWETDDGLLRSAIDAMRRADPEHDPSVQAARLARERADAAATARARLRGVARRQFDLAYRSAAVLAQARERSKATVIRAIHGFRLAARELARRAVERGAPEDLRTLWLVTRDELDDYLAHPPAFAAVQHERAETAARLGALVPPFVFVGRQPDPSTWPSPSPSDQAGAGAVLQGIAGSPGIGRGRARIVHDPADADAVGPGDVLVAPITDPAWTPLFVPVEAVVVDVGAQMSHAVIVSRELGIPCVVSVTGATTAIADGSLVEVDGTHGTVTVLESGR